MDIEIEISEKNGVMTAEIIRTATPNTEIIALIEEDASREPNGSEPLPEMNTSVVSSN